MSELLPCPFCGSDDLKLQVSDVHIKCLACEAEMSRWDGEDIIALWNTRRPVTEAAPCLKCEAVEDMARIGLVPDNEAAPSSPAWVELARLVAEAEGFAYASGELTGIAGKELIEGCRRVIRLAQQEAAPGGVDMAWLRTVEARHAESEGFLASRGKGAPDCHRDRASLLAIVHRLLTPAPNREAELKVIEAAKEVNEMDHGDACCSDYENDCRKLDALRDALASLAQAEMKGEPK